MSSSAPAGPAPGGAARWAPRVVAALTCALGGATVLLLTRLPVEDGDDFQGRWATGLFVLGMTALAVTGALLAARNRPTMAGLLMATGLLGVGARLTVGVALLLHDRGLPGAEPVGWLTNWSWVPGQAAALLLLLRFPTGRLPGPRWRAVELTVLGWTVAAVAVTAFVPGPLGVQALAPMTNPIGLDVVGGVLDGALGLLFTVVPVLVVACVAAPVARWRTARGAERAQLSWVLAGTALLAVATPLALVSGLGRVLEGLAYAVLPGAIALAVVRHRLWDVDLRQRLDRLRAVREEEQARLQRDLHDGLGPLLGSISMRAEAARNMLDSGSATGRVDEVLATIGRDVEAAVVEVRRIIEGLRPTALVGTTLVEALDEHLESYAAPVALHLHVEGRIDDVDDVVQAAVFRIACEAVRNTVRHAGARTCTVRLHREGDTLLLRVDDDGRGLTGPAGIGRTAMAERAREVGGELRVGERPGGGVRVEAALPARTPDGVVTS